MKKYLFTCLLFAASAIHSFGQSVPHITQVQPVATVAALRALKPQIDNTLAVVSGYYAANDRGGGTFYYDADSVLSDDGGAAIAPTGYTTGRWIRDMEGSVDVRYFGAKGDGETDDRAAIQAAIDYALAQNKELFVSPPNPGKYYEISSIHPDTVGEASPTALLIKHPTSTRVVFNMRGAGIDRGYNTNMSIRGMFEAGSAPYSLIRNEQEGGTIENIQLRSQNTKVIMQEADYSAFKHYRNVGMWGREGGVEYCLHVPGWMVSSIEDCHFTGATIAQVYIGGDPLESTSFTIKNSYANQGSEASGTAIGWYLPDGGAYSSMMNCAADSLYTGYYIGRSAPDVGRELSMINCGAEFTHRPVYIDRAPVKIDGFSTFNTYGRYIISQGGTTTEFKPNVIDGRIVAHWHVDALASWTAGVYILGGTSNWDVRTKDIAHKDVFWDTVANSDSRTVLVSDTYKGYLANTATGKQLVIPFGGEKSAHYAKEIRIKGIEAMKTEAPLHGGVPDRIDGAITFTEYNGEVIASSTTIEPYSSGISSITSTKNQLLVNLSGTYTTGIHLDVEFRSANNRWYVDYASSSFMLK